MKRISALVLFLTLCAVSLGALDSRFQSITSHELIGYGDFTGSGQLEAVIVDRATGLYRRAIPGPGGTLAVSNTALSGLTAADALATGPVTTAARDQLVVAGIAANRSHVLNPADPAAPPIPVFSGGVGHRSIAAVNMAYPGNNPDLFDLILVAGSYPDPNTVSVYQSSTSGPIPLSEAPFPDEIRRIQRVRLTESGPDYLLYFSNTGGSETLNIADPSMPEAPPVFTRSGFPVGIDAIHGPFRGANNHFLFFSPGSPELRVSAADPTKYLSTPVLFNLGAPIASVHHTHTGSQLGFFVVFGDGQSGAFYRLDASARPVSAGSLAAAPGQRLSGLISVQAGHVHVLSGPENRGPSDSVSHYVWAGSQWEHQSTQALPVIDPLRVTHNVLLFTGEPFVNPNAVLTQVVHVPDWTSSFRMQAGGTATLVAETATGNGLTNREAISIGSIPAGTTHGLVNQFGSEASTFGLGVSTGRSAPQIFVSPPPGSYNQYFTVTLSCSDTTATIYYRTDGAGPWSMATQKAAVAPPGNTLRPFFVEYFSDKDGVRSPIQSAAYAFAGQPGALDSDGDGIPDYVKLALGLDPTGGPDNDGDGFSDLREILAGTDPADPTDVPASLTALNLQNVFDAAVLPLSFSTFTTNSPTRPPYPSAVDPEAPPSTGVRAYDLDGRLLRSVQTHLNAGDSFPLPSAFLGALPATQRDGFVIAATDASFAIQPAAGRPILDDQGIELLALIPVPALAVPPVPYSPPPGIDPVAAADAWIAAAQAHYSSLERPRFEQDLTNRDTVKLLLTERIIALLLRERDPAFPRDAFSLTPFRDPPPATEVPSDALLSLQAADDPAQAAYRLQEIFATVSGGVDSPFHASIAHFRTLSEQVYRTANLQAAAEPGLYPSPVDVLRAFLRGSALPGHPDAGYAAAVTLSAAQLSSARGAPTVLRNALNPRPVATFHAEVMPSTFDGPVPILRLIGSDATLRLYDASASPFPFPGGLSLLPGTELEILAYDDRTVAPYSPGEAVETISVVVTRIPTPATVDLDGNGLDDAWELFFFGSTGVDPFGDADGNGFTNLQEFLEGTHPLIAASTPDGPPLPPGPPVVDIEDRGANGLRIRVHFPRRYSDQIGFRLETATELNTGAFVETALTTTAEADDTYTVDVVHDPTVDGRFYRFRLFLR